MLVGHSKHAVYAVEKVEASVGIKHSQAILRGYHSS